MAKNQVQFGRTLTFAPAPAGGVKSGGPLLIGAAFGVAQYDAPEGGAVEADVEGVHSLPKAAGVALGFGARVYFAAGAGTVTGTATGNTLIGYCARAAVADDARIDVRLVPQA